MAIVFYGPNLFLIVTALHSCLHSQVICSNNDRTAIGCFRCDSRENGNCSDPFRPSLTLFDGRCQVPVINQTGLFPAQHCLKVFGRNQKTGKTLVIRTCALEEADLSGEFVFEGQIYEGYLRTCSSEGCNGISKASESHFYIIYTAFFLLIVSIH